MAPNLLDKMYMSEANSAEPVQIISQPLVSETTSHKPFKSTTTAHHKWQIVWRNIALFIILHIFALQGIYYVLSATTKFKTFAWAFFVAMLTAQGITSGAHRLWAHRSYKAKLPLRIFLGFCQTAALQNHIYEWVRDHRVHHKFTDSDADPHNASRGFFFSHMGWLLVRKHKDVFVKGKAVDLSDLLEDPVVRFQKKYYLLLAPICCFGLPVAVPWYFWNENIYVSLCVAGMMRYALSLHCTWLVNSAAHIWGTKPYDNSIKPVENKSVSIVAFGEGWHNYHHVYPWDYKAAELGNYRMNFSTAFIDFMAKIGLAYDLKSASVDLVNKRAKRTGDGSRKERAVNQNQSHTHHHDHEHTIWGWGDKDMSPMDVHLATIDHKMD